MSKLPLLAHNDWDSPLAYRSGQVITVRQYLSDVNYVANYLADGNQMLLACDDRYHFCVGFGAAISRGQSCLLPSTHTPETIKQLREQFPTAYCLTDDPGCSIDLPQTQIIPLLKTPNAEGATPQMPLIDAAHVAAYVFTSGSTGAPVPNAKLWGGLIRNARAEALSLGLCDTHSNPTLVIVGTVPPQHMYGFESTVLIAMHNGFAFEAKKPFYPADITATLASLPSHRMLVTTPFHLRTYLSEEERFPPIDLVLCATAPLSPQLAAEAEEKLKAPLKEIYGCTESGQLATRRTTASQVWTMMNDIKVTGQHDDCYVSGGHVHGKIKMNDILDVLTPETFLLHGRSSDVINIAGKRTSLAYLNHHLNSIKGVEDGAFVLPDHAEDALVTRLAAFVVAPSLSEQVLLQQLRARIDAVFMPRPLRFVKQLPRNSTGKLPREQLLKLLASDCI